MANNPIGIFDSGLGGLTVATQVARKMTCESIYYVGDTKRCPYGPRDLSQVQLFSQEIALWLKDQGVKLIIIACNTATAAALDKLSQTMDIPVLGVIRPGALGAVRATKNQRIGVLATQGTVDSGIYEKEIHKLMPQAKVVQVAAPKFVELVEKTLASAKPGEDMQSLFDTQEVYAIVQDYAQTLIDAQVDTVVLGCTHFPILTRPIQKVLGDKVCLVDPACLAAEKAKEILEGISTEEQGELCFKGANASFPEYRFATTADDIDLFSRAAARIFPFEITSVNHISLRCLEAYGDNN